ncbi:hypothetical protein U8335_08430 [Roseiconus lacunae]|uniref:hypothetical protein n=1 Tax=Roseiconus lacunae TaxID=2605694 RepID=UPI003087991A|nr:hypothetical protein U8335_08430 [Stieleria sp. HD01]
MTYRTRRLKQSSPTAIAVAFGFPSHRILILPLLILCGVLLGSTWPHSAQAGERWTDLYGKRTIEADFIGLWGNNVVLEMPGGRRLSVSMDQLIAESRIQARQLEEEQKRRRTESRSLIEADAKEAAAPAPTPLPEPPSVATYAPYSGSGDILSVLEWQANQFRNGHMLITAFDSLPPSYQVEIEQLVKQTVGKLDPTGTQQTLASIHSIGELIVTRQRWLFSYPRLANMDDVNRDMIKKLMLSLGGAIRDGFDPQELKLEDLGTQPLRQWIVNLDSKLAPYLASLSDLSETVGIAEMEFEVVGEENGKATVLSKFGDLAIPAEYEKVEGAWIQAGGPEGGLKEQLDKWKAWLAETPDGSLLSQGQATMITVMINGFTQPALDAQNAREMHAQMDNLVNGLTPIVTQVAAAYAMGRNNRNNGYDQSGYGDEMGYEDMDQSGDDLYEPGMDSMSSGP